MTLHDLIVLNESWRRRDCIIIHQVGSFGLCPLVVDVVCADEMYGDKDVSSFNGDNVYLERLF